MCSTGVGTCFYLVNQSTTLANRKGVEDGYRSMFGSVRQEDEEDEEEEDEEDEEEEDEEDEEEEGIILKTFRILDMYPSFDLLSPFFSHRLLTEIPLSGAPLQKMRRERTAIV